MPSDLDPYVTFISEKTENINSWNIGISTYDKVNMEFNTVYKVEIHDLNYYKIPSQYLDGEHFISYVGKTDGRVVFEDGPIYMESGLNSSFLKCSYHCSGPDYAYTIDLHEGENLANDFFQFRSLANFQGFNQNDRYQFVSENEFLQWGGENGNPPHPKAWYNLPTYSYYENYPDQKIIRLTGVNTDAGSTIIRDINNNVLTGTVYGIKKYHGPWHPAGGNISYSTQLANPDDECSSGITNWNNILNNNSSAFETYNIPPLNCYGAIDVNGGGTPVSSYTALPSLIDCYDEMITDGESDAQDLWSSISDCLDDEINNSGTGLNWPSEVAVFHFKPINIDGDNTNEVSIAYEDFFDANGNFQNIPVTLYKGLYTLGIQFKDNSYLSMKFENSSKSTTNILERDLVSISTYPVPITGNDFNIQLSADAKVKFTYSLVDQNMTEYYSKNFVLQKGHNRSHQIKAKSNLPNGLLFNRLVFEDGSVLIQEIIKQ